MVSSSTLVHSYPRLSMNDWVPPVDMSFTPSAFSFLSISSSPSLWNTEIRAVLIGFSWVIFLILLHT